MSPAKDGVKHTIREVADRFGIEPSTLRYWEEEFGRHLRLRRNRRNQREYSESDIEVIKKIHELMHVELYTIEGAKRRLRRRC